MVMMTITAINVSAQPEPSSVSATDSLSIPDEPVIIKKSPRRYMFLELDSNELRGLRIDSLRIVIIRTLDSISKTKNFRLVNKTKFFLTNGGEFSLKEFKKGAFEFSGTCGCDIYRITLRDVYWDRLGKKFRFKFGTVFYGDPGVELNIVEPRYIEFLKRLRTPINK